MDLDNEEKDVLESHERGELKPAKNRKREIRKLQQYARNTLQKEAKINIQTSPKDSEEKETT